MPCGTPAFTDIQSDTVSPSFTRCFRSDRKLHIQGIKHLRTPKFKSFSIRILMLIRSKALLKSRRQTRNEFPCLSTFDSQLCSISRRHFVVDPPLRLPNCLASILSHISSVIQSTTNSSRTFERVEVKEIGRKSQRILGGDSLGIEDIFACFQISGTTPDDNETLKISVMGVSAISV